LLCFHSVFFVFQSGVLSLLFAAFWSQKIKFAAFGSEISHLQAICSILEQKLFILDAICSILDLGSLVGRKFAGLVQSLLRVGLEYMWGWFQAYCRLV
jgi:hypothetical protein